MLWQNKYFAFLSLFGISITIAVIMAFFIVLENKTGNIAPEVNASRMVFLGDYTVEEKQGNDTWWNGYDRIQREIAEKCLLHLNSAEQISFFRGEQIYLVIKGIDELTFLVHTDQCYWDLYRFKFLSGRGFTNEEFNRQDPVIIICRDLANKLFLETEPIGQTITINFVDYRVVGVVDDVPMSCVNTYAQIWTPCFETTPLSDYCNMAILLKKDATPKDLQKDVDDACNQLNLSGEFPNKKFSVTFFTRLEQVMHRKSDILSPRSWNSNDGKLLRDFIFRWFGLLGAFLLIMLSNQTGVNLTRIRERSVEMGIRKAFGAGRVMLILQLFSENIFISALGGLIGTLLAWWIVSLFKLQLFALNHVFFSSNLFLISLCLVFFVGIFTSLIPMRRVIRSSISENLKEE